MNIDELSSAWNEMRNAALGRGLKANVSAELAKVVAGEYERWRAARAEMGPVDDVLSAFTTRQWVTRYRNLVSKVQKEGIKLANVLPPTTLERALQGIDKWNRNFAIGLGVGAGIVVTVIFATRGNGSNG